MTQYMLLLHQVPNYNMDLPREKMMEMTKRYMAWADGMRQKGKLAGGEKLAAGGVRHIKVKDGKPVASDGPYAEAKDVVGGYFVIEAKDAGRGRGDRPDCPHLCDRRHQLGRDPADRRHGPGPGGRELSGRLERAPVHNLVASLARNSAHRLVAALARRLGAGRIAVAEDAVQHALLQALSLWPFKGVPSQARGVARHRRQEPRARPAARRSAPGGACRGSCSVRAARPPRAKAASIAS